MSLTLDQISNMASTGLNNVESSVNTSISGMSANSAAGLSDIVALQVSMSKFTIAANTFSSIVKEVTDTMKGVVAKIS